MMKMIRCALPVVLAGLAAGLLAGCAGGGGVAGVPGPGAGEAPHGAAVLTLEVIRLF